MRKRHRDNLDTQSDQFQQFAQEVTRLLAGVFQVPLEVLTGQAGTEKDPKKEGDA